MNKRIVYLAITFVIISVSFALAGAPPPPPPPPSHCFPNCIPIDGGISLLLAAGVAYGGKKMNEARKKQVSSEE